MSRARVFTEVARAVAFSGLSWPAWRAAVQQGYGPRVHVIPCLVEAACWHVLATLECLN